MIPSGAVNIFRLFIRRNKIVRNAKNRYGVLLDVEITTHFSVHTTLNIAVVMGVVSATDVSLSFFCSACTTLLS